ncbi:MAG: class I SAM-dependent methyltransferase, partial [Halioglobus sp.]
AAVKKDLATLQVLLGPQDDGDELLEWALSQAVARVVVKRPPRAQALAGVEPSHCISGKAVRYDVHVLRGLA